MNIKHIFTTVEYHVGRAPARIVTAGCPPIIGDTMIEKTKFVRENLDFVRQGTIQPPRGDASVMGAILTSPCSADADVGVVFIDINGYQNMCGHVSMAVGRLVHDERGNGSSGVVKIDTAAGLVSVRKRGGEMLFSNVPSFWFSFVDLFIPEVGDIPVDICFGGDFFVVAEAGVLNIDLSTACIDEQVEAGLKLFEAAEGISVCHPIYQDINKVDVAMIYQKDKEALCYRNVVVSDGGYWDRCPCGSGSSALSALLHAKGENPVGSEFVVMSPVGSMFTARVVAEIMVGNRKAVLPEVGGRPILIGLNQWVVENRNE